MTQIDEAAVENIDAAQFASIVSEKSDAEIAEILAHAEQRTLLLDTIFGQMERRIRPERAKGMQEVIHWRVLPEGEGDPDAFQVVIDDGKAIVGRELDRDPRVTFEIHGVSFIRMIAGQTTGMKLALGRKLKIKGDMMFASQMTSFFKIPTAG